MSKRLSDLFDKASKSLKSLVGPRKNKLAICDAINEKNLAKLRSLLESREYNLNCKDENSNTPLHLAILRENNAMFDLLLLELQRSIRFIHNPTVALVKYLNHKNNLMNTPLHLAVLRNNLHVVTALVKIKGVNLNSKNKILPTLPHMQYGDSPVHIATRLNYVDMVKLFLQVEASPNKVDLDCINGTGNTILHYAVMNKNLDLVKMFVEAGSRIDLINNVGDTPLTLSLNRDNLKRDKHTSDVSKFLATVGRSVRKNLGRKDKPSVYWKISFLNEEERNILLNFVFRDKLDPGVYPEFNAKAPRKGVSNLKYVSYRLTAGNPELQLVRPNFDRKNKLLPHRAALSVIEEEEEEEEEEENQVNANGFVLVEVPRPKKGAPRPKSKTGAPRPKSSGAPRPKPKPKSKKRGGYRSKKRRCLN